jgi:hypothetical protein
LSFEETKIVKTIFAAIILLAATAGSAQVTISPLNAEFGKKAKGEFSLTNGAFSPLAVTFELASVDIHDGKFGLTDLQPTTHIKLSEYSARIPAKQTHTVGYSITCDAYPCGVVILSTIVTGHTDEGLAVATRLGTVVYVCSSAKHCRDSILKP